jgi:enoyl-CoA hydratase/carnithine racemase
MNRPDELNALNTQLSDALKDAWARFESDTSVRLAVLGGAGRAFCAGAGLESRPLDDLGELHQFSVSMPAIFGTATGHAVSSAFDCKRRRFCELPRPEWGKDE